MSDSQYMLQDDVLTSLGTYPWKQSFHWSLILIVGLVLALFMLVAVLRRGTLIAGLSGEIFTRCDLVVNLGFSEWIVRVGRTQPVGIRLPNDVYGFSLVSFLSDDRTTGNGFASLKRITVSFLLAVVSLGVVDFLQRVTIPGQDDQSAIDVLWSDVHPENVGV